MMAAGRQWLALLLLLGAATAKPQGKREELIQLLEKSIDKLSRQEVPPACVGSTPVLETDAVITSPDRGDGNYPIDADCKWTVRASAGSSMKVTFDKMDLEVDTYGGPGENPSCYDSLTIIDEDGNRYEYCDPPNPHLIVTGTELTVIFRSDDDTVQTGFQITVTSLDGSGGHDGGNGAGNGAGNAQETSQSVPHPCIGTDEKVRDDIDEDIFSPNYGHGNYPSDTDCTWILKSLTGDQVRVEFVDLDLEKEEFFSLFDDATCYDTLTISDGSKEYEYCEGSPDDLVISGREVTIRFKSDQSMEEPGFHIKVTSESA